MMKSTRPSQRVATTALLMLALAITTGWTQAAPAGPDLPSKSRAALAVVPGGWLHGANVLAARSGLIAHRDAEASAFSSARMMSQARATAARPASAPMRVKAPVVKATVVKAAVKTYSATNHFWFPALGISRSVHLFPCSRQTPPGSYLYRWGCAGSNNVYLMGHAAGVFAPLANAYNAGRLRVGMLVKYADGSGRVRTYRITTWRVVDPVDSAWALASQPVPSMTLQTCVGPNSADRLNVRLVIVR